MTLYEEEINTLTALTAKYERKNKHLDRCKAFHLAIDCMQLVVRYAEYGDCNTCTISRECQYRPQFGDPVRINCPLYQGSFKTSERA